MTTFFFPSSVFAWVFIAVLAVPLAVAAWKDRRTMTVPKWVTLTTLALGFAASLVRGAWLGSLGLRTWWLTPGGVGIGMLDGFLFALCGFLAAFGMMFALWVLGVCGGGDVKNFAAIGAWVGPVQALIAFLLAGGFLSLAVIGLSIVRLLSGRPVNAPVGARTAKSRVMTFSVPLLFGALAALLIVLGNDIRQAQVAVSQGQRAQP